MQKSVSTDSVHKLLEDAEALRSALDPLQAKYGTLEFQRQAEELIALSANLTDEQKMIAGFWSASPDSDSPVAHWMRFAEFVSARDHHSLDDDVKMFFALSNAMMDADIAAWDAKRYYDSVRPATAIPLIFRGKAIKTWGGSGKGTVQVDGGQWLPYQSATLPTPPSPDYVSETSAELAYFGCMFRVYAYRQRVRLLSTGLWSLATTRLPASRSRHCLSGGARQIKVPRGSKLQDKMV